MKEKKYKNNASAFLIKELVNENVRKIYKNGANKKIINRF